MLSAFRQNAWTTSTRQSDELARCVGTWRLNIRLPAGLHAPCNCLFLLAARDNTEGTVVLFGE